MIGNGGHAKQLIAEGCKPDAKLVAIGDNRARKKEAEALKGFDGRWSVFVSAGARLLRPDEIAEGVQILSGAHIGSGARIGRHTIVNHLAVVDHEARVGSFCHIAPGAKVLGGADVGEGVLVGANAVVLPGQVVPPWSIVAAGTVWGYPRPKRRKKCVS